MIKHTSVSAVIPAYNAGRFVTQAIDSVLSQTIRPLEIVVVDDGSTDDTCQKVEGYGSSVRYIFQPNAGVAAARNHGVKATRGELVAFLDADDIWHPRKLELHLDAMGRRPELSLVGTDCFDWPRSDLPRFEVPPNLAPLTVPWKVLVLRNLFTTSTVIVRKSAFERSGGFDTDLRGPEDRDLWWRIAEIAEVGKLSMALTGYRRAEGTLGNQAVTMDAGGYLRLRKMDARGVWKGDWLLRRKAYSQHCYACRNMYETAGQHSKALKYLLRSFAWYPIPYRRSEVKTSFARPRAFGVTALRTLSRRVAPHTAVKPVGQDNTPGLRGCGIVG